MTEEKGITTRDNGVFIPKSERVPTNKANLRKSKSQFIKDERKRKEKDLRLEQISADIDKEQGIEAPVPVEEKKKKKSK